MMDDAERDRRQLRKYLRELTWTVQWFSVALDAEMRKPSTSERGKRVAKLMNELDMRSDAASHFALGKSFQAIKNSRRRLEVQYGAQP